VFAFFTLQLSFLSKHSTRFRHSYRQYIKRAMKSTFLASFGTVVTEKSRQQCGARRALVKLINGETFSSSNELSRVESSGVDE
jgi:hypothetical protein